LVVALNVPLAQSEQVRSLVVLPAEATNLPATHVVLATQGVAGSPSSSHVSALHETSGAVLPAQYVPAAQAEHEGGVVSVAGAVCRVPAGQAPTGTHAPALMVLLYSPVAHGAQARSSEAVPESATYSPGWQSVHGSQAVALVSTLKLPEAQPSHTTSEVGVPAALT
jgi:hypothetical protein